MQTIAEKAVLLAGALYNSATVRFPAPRGLAQLGEHHETCGQDVDPDGRFGLHVRGNRDPDTQCRTGPDATVQSSQSQLLEKIGKWD